MQKNNSDSHLNSTSLISETASIKGDIDCGGDMRIDGNVLGNIVCKGKLVIGFNSKITGDINAENLDIGGNVLGHVKITSSIVLRSGSSLTGNIELISANLEIEETAIFNGSCSMGSR